MKKVKVVWLKVLLALVNVINGVMFFITGGKEHEQTFIFDPERNDSLVSIPVKKLEIWAQKQYNKTEELIEKIENKIEYLEDDWYNE